MTQLAAAEAYRLWAPEYDATPNPLLALEERLLRDELRRAVRGLVLDVGCGTGRWGRLLEGCRYFGVDRCAEMLRGNSGAGFSLRRASARQSGSGTEIPSRLKPAPLESSSDLEACSGMGQDAGVGHALGCHPSEARTSRRVKRGGRHECLPHFAPSHFVAGNALALPVRDGAAALTISSFVLAYIDSPEAALAEWARVTRRGGMIVVSDMHPDAGWSRTFRSGDEVHEIEHHRHAAGAVLEAAARVGLRLEREITAGFGEEERPVFRAAGREDLLERARGTPALWAAFWIRP